ncbi:MAG: hypothetical protein CMJ89_12900 [Planctomycetes bacterium]|nr:hypothetical protein [Planctomycetota bacterium]
MKLSPSSPNRGAYAKGPALALLALFVGCTNAGEPFMDLTPPSILGIQVYTDSAGNAAIAWSTDETALWSVEYGLTMAYGSTVQGNTPATSHFAILTGLIDDADYHCRILCTDADGNESDSGDITFQQGVTGNDQTAPAITMVDVSVPGGGTAIVSWTTDELSTGRLEYGTTSAYGTTITVGPPRATEHTVGLMGLDLDTAYHFAITATDLLSNSGSTNDDTFYSGASPNAPDIQGNLVTWCPLTLSFHGPTASETDDAPNPFLDYRLTVDFAGPSGQMATAHGFFDGDGNGGGTGDVWRVHFAPDEGGVWSYTAHFVQGADVAIDLSPGSGTPTDFDGETGTVTIAPVDAGGEGFYKWGLLEYVGAHYLKFRDGPYFLKMGCDSPENLLAYKGFDNTIDQGGNSTQGLENGLHRYQPHIPDWGPGGLGDSTDPFFTSADTGYDSKGIVGALNYLSSMNVNSVYFLPMNLGGDGQEVCPFVGYSNTTYAKTHYDISKLYQWDQIFEHATSKGILLHFVLAETEAANRNWLDNGTLGIERKLFYREMVARFGHALAIKWNLSEECLYAVTDSRAFAGYIQSVDPYDHPIGFHTYSLPADGGNNDWSAVLGDTRFSTNSTQSNVSFAGGHVEVWRQNSANAGHKWVVEIDEITTGLTDVNATALRQRGLYDVLFSGGGIEWYFGYVSLPLGGDLRVEDFRTRQDMWQYGWYARRFMEENLPFWEMQPADALVNGESFHSDGTGAEVFIKPNDTYAVYFPVASSTGTLDLSAATGTFQRRWFDPTTGLFVGTPDALTGGGIVNVGPPPNSPGMDWVMLLER